MPTIVVYSFEGTYTGDAEYEYQAPEPGARHRCVLFVSQEKETPDYERAVTECKKYGFAEVEFYSHGALDTEALSAPRLRGFAAFYEEALNAGSALAYYPES